MPAQLINGRFDPAQVLAQHQSQLVAGSFGACASFVGSMRNFNAGDTVTAMTLEHYPAMTQQFLDQLCRDAFQQYALVDCLIVHRVGLILPGEPIVLTVAWAAHRSAAFDACRQLMEALKAEAPFWKKETTAEGERWVHDTE